MAPVKDAVEDTGMKRNPPLLFIGGRMMVVNNVVDGDGKQQRKKRLLEAMHVPLLYKRRYLRYLSTFKFVATLERGIKSC